MLQERWYSLSVFCSGLSPLQKKRWKWRSLIFAYGNVYAFRVQKYNKNNENDKTSICSYVVHCRYISHTLKYSHVYTYLCRCLVPVGLSACLFLSPLWFCKLSPTHVHIHMHVKALLSLSDTHTCTGPHTCAGVFCICLENMDSCYC